MTMLRVSEVAVRLSCEPETVRRWIREGKIPAYRLGRPGAPLRISEEAVREFLTARQVTPTLAEPRAPRPQPSTTVATASPAGAGRVSFRERAKRSRT